MKCLKECPYLIERPLTSWFAEDFMSRHVDGELGHHWMELISRVFFGGGWLGESLGSGGPQDLLSVLLLGIAVV